MSNFDRAVKALNDVDEAIDHLADNEAYVAALEAAGLLMPDLPKPVSVCESGTADWLDGAVYTHGGSGKIRVIIEDSRYPVESARELALSILAACEYTVKEKWQ